MLPINIVASSPIFERFRRNPYLIWADRYLAYVCVAAVVVFLLLVPTKIWETNDDIAMAMISQGYGIAAHSSPGIIFSNVIWGWIVMHLPGVGGLESYTLATYCLLLGAGASIAVTLHQLRASSWMGGCILLFMLTQTLLIPQFTIVAGYLAVAGVAMAWTWRGAGAAWPLWVAGILLILAGLVRGMELLFVLAVMWPFFLPTSWAALKHREYRRLAMLGLCVASILGVAHAVDKHYYSSSEWSAFRQINSARVPYTDYRVGAYIAQHPELTAGTGLSTNDVKLFSAWFYQDPQVFDGPKFAALSAKVSPSARISANHDDYLSLLRNFRHKQFLKLFLLFPLLLLLGLRRNTPALAAFTLVLLAMLGLSLLGRGSETRVYIAPMSGVLILLLATLPVEASLRVRWVGICGVVFAASLALWWGLGQQSNPAKPTYERLYCDAAKDRLLVTWGSLGTPTLMLYRPGFHARPSCGAALYSLGTMQLAPFALENLQRGLGTDTVVQALLKGESVSILTSEGRLAMLEEYMRQHHGHDLDVANPLTLRQLNMYVLRMGKPASALPDRDKPGGGDTPDVPDDDGDTPPAP